MVADGADRRILWHITMSLDGFIAGPDDAMDWAFGHASGPNAAVDEVLRTTGAILAGRRWYDLAAGTPGAAPYGGAWSGPVLVLTHRPPPTSPDPAVTFVSDGVRDAVDAALEAAAGKNVVVFGASVAAQCLEAGLLDEILVHLAPVMLGRGVRMFERPGAGPSITLERIGVEEWGQVTNLRFRVQR